MPSFGVKSKWLIALGALAVLAGLLIWLAPAPGHQAAAATPFLALSRVPVVEMPATAADLVQAAPVLDRQATAAATLRALPVRHKRDRATPRNPLRGRRRVHAG